MLILVITDCYFKEFKCTISLSKCGILSMEACVLLLEIEGVKKKDKGYTSFSTFSV